MSRIDEEQQQQLFSHWYYSNLKKIAVQCKTPYSLTIVFYYAVDKATWQIFCATKLRDWTLFCKYTVNCWNFTDVSNPFQHFIPLLHHSMLCKQRQGDNCILTKHFSNHKTMIFDFCIHLPFINTQCISTPLQTNTAHYSSKWFSIAGETVVSTSATKISNFPASERWFVERSIRPHVPHWLLQHCANQFFSFPTLHCSSL